MWYNKKGKKNTHTIEKVVRSHYCGRFLMKIVEAKLNKKTEERKKCQ